MWVSHSTVTVKPYTTQGVTYQLIDAFGQKLTGTATTTFTPSELLDSVGRAAVGTVSENAVK